MAAADLTCAKLSETLRYDPLTGEFYRLRNTGSTGRIGPVVVRPGVRGALALCVQGKRYYAHRLAWLYVTGEWPRHEIDHIDGNALNNRFGNLREANSAQNKQNMHRPRRSNKSGALGVFKHGTTKAGQIRWRARIQLNGRTIHLGLFDSVDEAHQAYLDAKRKLHPFGVL